MPESIKKYILSRHGYATMSDLKKAGFHTRKIREALEDETIAIIKPGLYKLRSYNRDKYESFVDIHMANPKAVICLTSALAYHDLTTNNPPKVTVAVPNNTDRFQLTEPPIEVFYFRQSVYDAGIEMVDRGYGRFSVYNKPKTVCDMFRYRNKLGDDLALEGLKRYLSQSDANLNELRHYMNICRVRTIMTPYVKAIIAE
jgi:predicted transcriptional regulator of viral defense system